ncbi:hypothetical protein, partial [Bacillus sp. JJ722]|uniref:spr1630 family ClpXP-sensitive toxin n=1 Tax=Bacillus sp. JJ722 TaxID=3122973 RepID=UPI0030003A33
VISSAYAWVKGNHIEDSIAKICSNKGIEYIPSKAGYAWGYLQFSNKDTRSLFIIKNKSSLGRNISSIKNVTADENNYLVELSNINSDLDISLFESEKTKNTQLSFFEQTVDLFHVEDLLSEINRLKEAYDRFYVISYEIEDMSKMISEIKLLLPSPGLVNTYEVDDWTHFIKDSSVEINDEDLESIKNDTEPQRSIVFGNYGIEAKKEQKVRETD